MSCSPSACPSGTARAAFGVVQRQFAGFVGGEQTSPDYLTQLALDKALYPPNDPQLRRETPDSVKALTLDDVKAYYSTVFRPDLTTIIVIGDVTPNQAKAWIEKWFGGWTATGPAPDGLSAGAEQRAVRANYRQPAASKIQ